MNNPPIHFYSTHANKILNWVGTDQITRRHTIVSDPTKYQQWTDSGWSEDSVIEYKFNEHGFRTDCFDQSLRLAVFGSSQTVGVGLAQDQTWVSHLNKMLNVSIWNLATGSGALDTCYRMLKYYVQHLNISAIILAVPEITRFEIWKNQSLPVVVLDEHSSNQDAGFWLQHNNNQTINREKNLEAIQFVCLQKNIPLITFELGDANKHKPVQPADWSRCLSHIGPKCHKNIAEFVVDRLWPTVNTPWH